jgi:hypothetical protein
MEIHLKAFKCLIFQFIDRFNTYSEPDTSYYYSRYYKMLLDHELWGTRKRKQCDTTKRVNLVWAPIHRIWQALPISTVH